MAIWPWAEANQGLLSLLALVVAFIFALYENWRANAASGDDRRSFADEVVGVIDHVLDLTAIAERAEAAGSSHDAVVTAWNGAIIAPRLTLDTLRRVPVRNARIALAINDLWQRLAWEMHPQGSANSVGIATFGDMKAMLLNDRKLFTNFRG